MKLNLAASALLLSSSLALLSVSEAYTVGGYDMFGRPIIVRNNGKSPPSGCYSPQQDVFRRQQEFIDEAFDVMNNYSSPRNRRRSLDGRRRYRREDRIKMNEDAIRKQQEFMNKAFDFATDFANEVAKVNDQKNDNRAKTNDDDIIRKQREFVNRAFNIASNVASGYVSPRYDIIQDDDEAFQVSLDLPGVKSSDMDVSIKEKDDSTKGWILTISGKREVVVAKKNNSNKEPDNNYNEDKPSDANDENHSNDSNAPEDDNVIKFSKSFMLDDAIDTESITAELKNGVLDVWVRKVPKKDEDIIVRKIPVSTTKVEKNDDETTSSVKPTTIMASTEENMEVGDKTNDDDVGDMTAKESSESIVVNENKNGEDDNINKREEEEEDEDNIDLDVV